MRARTGRFGIVACLALAASSSIATLVSASPTATVVLEELVALDEAIIPSAKCSFVPVLKTAARSALRGGLPGAIAGVVQVLALMWLRTVLNYQAMYGVNMGESARSLYMQGGVSRFYRGVWFALLQNPLSRFGMTAAAELAQLLAASRPGLPVAATAWIASGGAALWRMSLAPLDTCKTVLQVEGREGFLKLVEHAKSGRVGKLYSGAFASAAATGVAYFPWYLTFRLLSDAIEVPDSLLSQVVRNGFIGLVASFAADLASNGIRVLKTTKQASASHDVAPTYKEALSKIVAKDGVLGLLFGRGLPTRMLANGLQSILFTIVWRYLYERHFKIDA